MRRSRWLEQLRKSASESPLEPPIALGNVSNGEFFLPFTERTRKMRELILRRADETARRVGMDRRDFLASALGMATSLAVLNVATGCGDEEGASDGSDGGYLVPRDALVDCTVAEALLAGNEFILDMQTHHVEDREQWALAHPGEPHPSELMAQAFGAYSGCSDLTCIDTNAYFRKIFLESDTTVAVLSGFPSPICDDATMCRSSISNDRMVETRDTVNALSDGTQRCVQHCQVAPNDRWDLQQQMMERIRSEFGNHGWKCYPPWASPSAPGWYLTDPVGEQLIQKIIELGNPILCIHKGPRLGAFDVEHNDPKDVGPAAVAHPDVKFVVYHSGMDETLAQQGGEGPYDPAGGGVNRLIRTVEENGLKGKNVYAELGSVWYVQTIWGAEAQAHLIGKLVKHLGEDNVLWGSECTWFGSPREQINVFRQLTIPDQMQQDFGYPALTPELKAKIFGLNAARLYGIDPTATRCAIDGSQLAQYKRELDGEFGRYRWAFDRPLGPRSYAEFARLQRLRRAQGRPA